MIPLDREKPMYRIHSKWLARIRAFKRSPYKKINIQEDDLYLLLDFILFRDRKSERAFIHAFAGRNFRKNAGEGR
jgi:hypothetical protein